MDFLKKTNAGSEGTLRARPQRQGTIAEMKDEDSERGTGAKWHPCWVSPGGFFGGSWGASWGAGGDSWGAGGNRKIRKKRRKKNKKNEEKSEQFSDF